MIRLAGLVLPALFLTTAAFAQQADQPVLKGAAAFGDWRADRPGVRRLIRPEDLPKPYVTKSASNSAGLAERPAGAKPQVPPGFSAELVASGIDNPRVVRVAPNGDLFVADSDANQIRVYRLAEGSAEPGQGRHLRQRPRPALWHRLLSAGRRSAMGLCRQQPTASCAFPTATAT